MMMQIQRAQIVVPCSHFDATLKALTEQLGFRIDMIFPADSPAIAVVSGFGVTLRLDATIRTGGDARVLLRLIADPPPRMVPIPDLSIEWVDGETPIEIPAGNQEFILTRTPTRTTDIDTWVTGRAGMQYRDLVPGRFGGRFIASHIRIPDGWPVPDYVHFHKVRFQMIFCKAGWVRVVYEDQGEPFVLQAGDCVLQPPGIRHRVLEASAGLEVIELGCPAIHETLADHQLSLPTSHVLPLREFGGQKFVRHIGAEARWAPWRWLGHAASGFDARDTGIAAATSALAGALIVRAQLGSTTPVGRHEGEFLFLFILSGTLQMRSKSIGDHVLQTGDSVTIPSGTESSLHAMGQVEFLQVTLPAG